MRHVVGPKPTVIVFAKLSRLNRVKSRLARDIGPGAALRFYRGNLTRLHRRLSAMPGVRIVWCVSPDSAVSAKRTWPKGARLRKQGRGDLGQRMARALAAAPPGPVVLVGSDIPGIDRDTLSKTLALLGNKDAVFGPAEDGGYWLVGFRRLRPLPPDLFKRVRWSGSHALADTIATLPTGSRIGFGPVLSDVDDGPSYRKWKEGGDAPR